jgi:hypothetical protein
MPMPSDSSSADRIRVLRSRRPEALPFSPAPASETNPQQEVPDMGQYIQDPMSEPPLQMPQQPQGLNKTYRVPASMMPNQSPQEMAFWKAAKGF